MKLVMGNKNYSSWSFRPWIAMAVMGLDFEEVVIPMNQPDTRASMLRYSPTGLVPTLIDGGVVVWETLAILEYLADRHPEAGLWPQDVAARAHARAVSAEMHAGFAALRRQCPMNIRRAPKLVVLDAAAETDAARIDALWQDARQRFGGGGPFLFGHFTAADAMFAPVVNRFHAYALPRSAVSDAYMQAMMALPAWTRWDAASRDEPWVITGSEIA